MTNKNDFVEIGGECAQICVVLKRGTFGKKEEDISPSVMAAMSDLRKLVLVSQETSDTLFTIHKQHSQRHTKHGHQERS